MRLVQHRSKRAGLRQKTLVIFSSDNGPVWLPADVQKYGHSADGIFRGIKGDSWEGGHREPFIARFHLGLFGISLDSCWPQFEDLKNQLQVAE